MQLYKSYAKINLFLDVISVLKNGYHGIRSIFAEISLFDEIWYKTNSEGVLRFFDNKNILPAVNLFTKSGDAITGPIKSIPFGVDFYIDKNIPIGGGLGGGSSNAAGVLRILNDLWGLKLGRKKLKEISKSLGADVPFFIDGGLQEVSGIGEIGQKLKIKNLDCKLLLVFPDINVETRKAYRLIDDARLANDDKINRKKYKNLVKGLKSNDYDLIIDNIYNKFEEVIFPEYPEIERVRADVIASGADRAFMTGSGSTIVGVFENEAKIAIGMNNMQKMGYDIFKAEILYN
jgi:4-diphosphocytidyl-2-C-methyl-D-erythritol kinase